MPIIVKANKEYPLHPAGLFQAVCCDVVDLGLIKVTYSGQTREQYTIKVLWQSEEMRDDGKPLLLVRRYNASLNEKSSLRRDLESLRGRPFTPEELAGFDIENLLGVNAYLNVVHAERDGGKTYANVASVAPIKKGMPRMEVLDYVREKDRPKNNGDAGHGDGPAITEEDVPF
jgi:hypothetical protein